MALSTHLSNHKLYLLGMLCAILAWGMACIELRSEHPPLVLRPQRAGLPAGLER